MDQLPAGLENPVDKLVGGDGAVLGDVDPDLFQIRLRPGREPRLLHERGGLPAMPHERLAALGFDRVRERLVEDR